VSGLGILLFGAILADLASKNSTLLEGAQRYLAYRWIREVRPGGDAPPPEEIGRIVDQLIGGLPQLPKSMKIVRAGELASLGHAPPGEPASEAPALTSTATRDGPFALRLASLARDMRVFAACNIALFLLTAIFAYRGRSASSNLLVPAALLSASTLGAIALYITTRDWFWSFLEERYAGLGYLAFVAFVMLLLADIIWNEARIVWFMFRFFPWVHRPG
jgi:hypothetical protein